MKLLKINLFGLLLLIGIQLNAQQLLKSQKPTKAACTTLTLDQILPGAVDTTKGRAVANNDIVWENGDVIRVKFMNGIGSPAMRKLVMDYAKTWEQYANIKFEFVPDNDPSTNIRIKLASMLDGLGHNSQLGVNSNSVAQNKQTLNLDTSDFIDYDYYAKQFKNNGPFAQWVRSRKADLSNYTYNDMYADVIAYKDPNVPYLYDAMRGTTVHEFGHALGLMHEQSFPGGIQWNKDTVYAYYTKYQGWDKRKVDFNVLGASDIFYTNGTSYDPKSIMHYPVFAWQTTNGFTVGVNNELSAGDKKIIAALYPKDRKVSALAVPKIQIEDVDYGEVKIDNTRKGIVMYPSFDLKTSAILGNVYFVARLTTEDGEYYIPTKNENYSWNKNAAVYVKMRLLPSSKVKYNKGDKKNLELFFPYSEMPDLQGKTVKVEFTVFQDDLVNNRYQKLTFNFLSSPVSLPTKF